MTDPTSIDTITNLSGTGAIVGLFIWYLKSRDQSMERFMDRFTERFDQSTSKMGDKLEQLAHAIGSLERRLNDVESKQQRSRTRRTA